MRISRQRYEGWLRQLHNNRPYLSAAVYRFPLAGWITPYFCAGSKFGEVAQNVISADSCIYDIIGCEFPPIYQAAGLTVLIKGVVNALDGCGRCKSVVSSGVSQLSASCPCYDKIRRGTASL